MRCLASDGCECGFHKLYSPEGRKGVWEVVFENLEHEGWICIIFNCDAHLRSVWGFQRVIVDSAINVGIDLSYLRQ